jgi:hypothetical protein
MNVFFLFFPLQSLCPWAFVLKAGAKVQLLFYPASFFKKKFSFLKTKPFQNPNRLFASPNPSGLGGQR